jgi:hypothetical protein
MPRDFSAPACASYPWPDLGMGAIREGVEVKVNLPSPKSELTKWKTTLAQRAV